MWFEISIVTLLLLLGHILLGHFEAQTPRWRIWLKNILGIIILVAVSYYFGRFWFYIGLIIATLPALYIHLWWLPGKGINGWTGEPKDKYYELRGWKIDEKKQKEVLQKVEERKSL